MANLLIEIGNTALKAAWSEGLTLGKTYRYQGERTMDFIVSLTEREKPYVMAVASVKDIAEDEKKRLSEHCQHLLILDSVHSEILSNYSLPGHLSYDRAASLVAVRRMFEGKPCIVFDLGTKISVDVTDAQGNYLGGNTSVGTRTRFKALNRYSKALPLVNMPSETKQLGESVEESIASGVISGIMFELEGYTARYPGNVIVFTGGDADYFAKRMKISIFVVCNLVLMGLAYITDDYAQKNS